MPNNVCRRPVDPKISIVVPARNEAKNLELILPELPPVHEVILVDGHSVDDTIETARRVMPDIKVIQQTRRGKGNALACGFAAVTGDIIVMFDADGSADPRELPAFLSVLTAGADFAKGSRYLRHGGSADITRVRDMGNFTLGALANGLMRAHYTDLCYGYNAFWVHVLDNLDLPDHRVGVIGDSMLWGDGFEIETVINCRIAVAGLNVVEVASVERRRIHGESNLHAVSDGLRVLKTIVAERRRAGVIRRELADMARTAYVAAAVVEPMSETA